MSAVARHTPHLIERLFFDKDRAPSFAAACKILAQKRKTYRLVTGEELKKIADTSHHQGVAAVIHPPTAQRLSALPANAPALCLNDVMNSHNVGAIFRTAAFFGLRRVVLSRASFAAAMTASAWRVAEGGLTHAEVYVFDDDVEFFLGTAKRFAVAAALKPEKAKLSSLQNILAQAKLPVIVCLGNEEKGLPSQFTTRCTNQFTIAGSGIVDSLNVSVAAALCIEKLCIQRKF